MTYEREMEASDRSLTDTVRLASVYTISSPKAMMTLTYRQNVVLLLPKHLRADNMAVKPIARELRVTRAKNSSSGAW